MKTIAAFMLTMIFGIQFIMAQDQPVVKANKTYSWNETTHDFGKIAQNNPATVTFTVKNDGKAPLIITAARTSCGCTIAEYTKDPIKPGESGIVKATFNAAHAGPFTKNVTVTYDGIPDPDMLTIKGTVEAPPAPAEPPAPPPPGESTPVKK
jgi:hypothetical protein